MESVILQSPLVLLLLGAALFLNLFDRHYKTTRGIFTIVSAVMAIAATAWALILGGTLWECTTVLLVFLLLNMGVRE